MSTYGFKVAIVVYDLRYCSKIIKEGDDGGGGEMLRVRGDRYLINTLRNPLLLLTWYIWFVGPSVFAWQLVSTHHFPVPFSCSPQEHELKSEHQNWENDVARGEFTSETDKHRTTAGVCDNEWWQVGKLIFPFLSAFDFSSLLALVLFLWIKVLYIMIRFAYFNFC